MSYVSKRFRTFRKPITRPATGVARGGGGGGGSGATLVFGAGGGGGGGYHKNCGCCP